MKEKLLPKMTQQSNARRWPLPFSIPAWPVPGAWAVHTVAQMKERRGRVAGGD